MKTKSPLRTPRQEQRIARDLAIYNEHRELIANPDQGKKAAILYLMDKYDIPTECSIYRILNRTRERIASGQYTNY